MDEYIKREDALDAVLFAMSGTGYQSRAISAIHDAPTADVVPKREVAREIFEEIEKILDEKFSRNHGVVLISKEDFAELKKKYAEGE